MTTTAIQKLSQKCPGLDCRLLKEIQFGEKENKVRGKFAGVVLKVHREEKHTAFHISDGTATAEVTLCYRRIPPEYELPGKGASVEVVGFGYKKVLGIRNNIYSFYKIIASGIKEVSPEQELANHLAAALVYRRYSAKLAPKAQRIEKLEPKVRLRSFESVQEATELKSLVWTYCYYVFEHNPDIQSYVFNAEMIRASRDGAQFLNDARVTKPCLQEAINKVLEELVGLGLLSAKSVAEEREAFFVVKKDLLRGIEKAFEERILEMKDSGVLIEQLTQHVNKKLVQFSNHNSSIFDWKFSQKVLLKLQSLNKIYKTSDKLIFPNVRT